MSVKHILYTALLQVKTPVWVSHECAGPNETQIPVYTLLVCLGQMGYLSDIKKAK